MLAIFRAIAGFMLLFFAVSSHAVTLQFTLDELVQKLNEASGSNNPLAQALAQKIGEYLAEQNVVISPTMVVINQPVAYFIKDLNPCGNLPLFGWNNPAPIAYGLKRGMVTGEIERQNSGLALTVKERKITADAYLHGSVDMDTRAFVTWSFKAPDLFKIDGAICVGPQWNDDVDITAEIYTKATATLTMDVLNVSVQANTITIRNNFNLSGSATMPTLTPRGLPNPFVTIGDNFQVNSVSEFLFRGMIANHQLTPLISQVANKGVIDHFARSYYDDYLRKIETELRAKYGTYDFEVVFPPLDDERIIAAIQEYLETNYGFRDHPGVINALYSFTRANLVEILFALMTDDQPALERILVGAGCEVIRNFETALPTSFLYTKSGRFFSRTTCIAADPFGANVEEYYSDSACTIPVSYQPPNRTEYCQNLFGRRPNTTLGNAGGMPPDEPQPWTASYGNRLAVMAETNSGTRQPLMTRVNYHEVRKRLGSGAGFRRTCSLEMRVYKKDAAATGLQPLLAIHGGSWKYRGPFFALEALISQYTDAGFVVFAPFYRLVGEADGPAECNGASWTDVVDDVEAALDWVKTNQGAYGAIADEPIAVMGQSAGAHLAAWLVTHRPSDISRALLLYPPTDLLDFLRNRTGTYAAYNNADTVGTLNDFFQTDVTLVNVANPPNYVLQNSFTGLVNASTPPVFVLHGISDELIPSNQSVILCNSYGGTAQNSGGGTNLRATYACGAGYLHLFQQGRHGLDSCIRGQTGAAAAAVCLSGSDASADLVANSMTSARAWLRAGLRPPRPENCRNLLGARWCQ